MSLEMREPGTLGLRPAGSIPDPAAEKVSGRGLRVAAPAPPKPPARVLEQCHHQSAAEGHVRRLAEAGGLEKHIVILPSGGKGVMLPPETAGQPGRVLEVEGVAQMVRHLQNGCDRMDVNKCPACVVRHS